VQKTTTAALLTLLFSLTSQAVHARYAAIVIDAETGHVVHETEAAQRWYPASLTKVMTLYMTFKAIESGRLHLHDTLVASKHAAMQPNSRLGLRKGQQISVENAILAVATRSANDAAVTLAEHLGGSESHFAHLMTEQAHHLGMSSTSFVNASGLPDESQISSARDLAILSSAVIHHFPEHYHYFSTTEFHYKGQVLPNTNRILRSYPDADGFKTGFTCGSGYNLIASAKRNGHRLIGVLLGAHSSNERFEQMGNLLDIGFEKKAAGVEGTHVSQLRDNDFAPPPFQLASNRCAGSAVQMGADSGASDREPIQLKPKERHGRVSEPDNQQQDNWSITFGADSQKPQADKHLAHARHALGALGNKGQVEVVKRKNKGKSAWKVVWRGLDANDATNFCKHLQASIHDCTVLAPKARPVASRTQSKSVKQVSHKKVVKHKKSDRHQ
jgi:D-alanyl-D-alanine carboxypeptidase